MNNFNDTLLPNLISKKTVKDINKMFQNGGFQKGSELVKCSDWSTNLIDFYFKYINHNLFPIIVISSLFIFLIIKYILKKERDNQETIEILNDINHKRKQKRNNHIDIQRYQETQRTDDYVFPEQIYELPAIQMTDTYNDEQQNTYYDQFQNGESHNNLGNIEKQYDYLRRQGQMSNEMINDYKQNDISRMAFDELSRVIVGK